MFYNDATFYININLLVLAMMQAKLRLPQRAALPSGSEQNLQPESG